VVNLNRIASVSQIISGVVNLTGACTFKREILEKSSINGDNCESILKKSLPKYFWRIKGLEEDELRFEFLIDATDIAEGDLYLDFICYDPEYLTIIYPYLEAGLEIQIIKDKHTRYFLTKMMEKISALLPK